MTFADSYQFNCPADEKADRRDKLYDLSKTTIDHCESFCMGKGCGSKDSCPSYLSAKMEEGHYAKQISMPEQRQPPMEAKPKDDDSGGEIQNVED